MFDRWLAGAALVVASVLSVGAEEVSVGTRGAAISLDDSWKRKTLNPNLGPDQFVSSSDLYLMVLERSGVFDQRADFESVVDEFVAGIETRSDQLDASRPFEYRREEGLGYGRRHLTMKTGGLELAYELCLVGRDGLAYLLMLWSAESSSAALELAGSSLMRSVRLPGPDTPWGAGAQPTPRDFRFDEWTLGLSFRPSVFAVTESSSPRRVSLQSGDGNVGVHLFLDHLSGGIDAATTRVVDQVDDDDDLQVVSRETVDHPLGEAREVLLRTSGSEGGYDAAVMLVRVAQDTYADLRLVSAHPAGHREALWRSLTGSLRAVPPAVVDAFPVVEGLAEPTAAAIPSTARALLETCLQVATVARGAAFAADADGVLVAVESRRVVRFAAGRTEPEILLESEDWLGFSSPVVRGDEVLVVDSDREVHRILAGGAEPAGFVAALMAAAPAGTVLARTEPAATVLGLPALPNLHPTRLVVRDVGDTERVVAELAAVDATALAVSSTGDRALVALDPREPLGDDRGSEDGVELISVALDTGSRHPLDRWPAIHALAPADEGWLVSGRPADGSHGLYRLTDDGQRELLVSGRVTGIGLRSGELTFAVDDCLPPSAAGPLCVYRAALDTVRALGPTFDPVDGAALNAVAAELEPRQLPLASAEEVAERFRVATAACLRRTGVPLPSAPAAVDRLFTRLVGDLDLSEAAVDLLAAVLANAMLEQGATWVPSPTATPVSSMVETGWEGDTLLAVALRPRQVVVSTLYQEEGWYRPLSEVEARASGRLLLLGDGNATLLEALGRWRVTDLAELATQGRPAALTEALRARPSNTHLRGAVYRYLLASGHAERVAEVAGSMARGEHAADVDRQTWLAARLSLEPSAAEAERLVADLRDAIARDPDEPSLYLMLGAAYERTVRSDAVRLARACYLEASSLGWGETRTAADAAVARLDEGR